MQYTSSLNGSIDPLPSYDLRSEDGNKQRMEADVTTRSLIIGKEDREVKELHYINMKWY